MGITKHICPRDCYDACGMLAHVDERGRLIKVTGDPDHAYTMGRLCSKGYAYTDYVYNSQRLTSPMLQSPRFSGNWQPISWADAQLLDFGGTRSRNPSEMSQAKLLILWGVNPAATAIHQMPFIQEVRRNGGKVVLIDIIPTAVVNQVDEFIQVRPGGDGALALALLRQLMLNKQLDYEFIKEKTTGWDPLHQWLIQADSADLAKISGVGEDKIFALADLIASGKPVAFWPGSGMQRYANGGQNMRAIDALAAASGNLDLPGGGIFFQNIDFYGLNQRVFRSGMVDQVPKNVPQNRLVGLNANGGDGLNYNG